MDERSRHPLLSIYAALLRLYPSDFRQQFADEMLETFSRVLDEQGPLFASLLILRELLPTLFREHLDDPANLNRLIRRMLCPIPAMILYATSIARVQHIEEFALSTFWLICILASFWKNGCRGRVCLIRTVTASVMGMLFPLALINAWQSMSPGFFSLVVPVALRATTLGLILGLLARLTMEGIKLKIAA